MPDSHERQNHDTDDLLDTLSSARRMDIDGCPAFNAKKFFALVFGLAAGQVFGIVIDFCAVRYIQFVFLTIMSENMGEEKYMTLYRDNNPNAARCIDVSIKDGLIEFGQQDIGPLCEEMFGDSDYERIIFNLPARQLRAAMHVKTDEELLAVLKRDYGTEDAFDRFSKFVHDNHLEYDVYCG